MDLYLEMIGSGQQHKILQMGQTSREIPEQNLQPYAESILDMVWFMNHEYIPKLWHILEVKVETTANILKGDKLGSRFYVNADQIVAGFDLHIRESRKGCAIDFQSLYVIDVQ